MRALRIRHLRTRIVLAFSALLIVGQGIGYLLVSGASEHNARRQLDIELQAGERVFERVLEHNRNQLAQAAGVLAADFGFREAVATRDADTIGSALENHGARIAAASMLLIDREGRIVSGAGPAFESGLTGQPFGESALLDRALAEGFASTLLDAAAIPLQVVVVPVRAPVLIGWVAVGFRIDDTLARDLERLTDLEVTFLHVRQDRWTVFASTHDPALRPQLQGHLASAGPGLDAALTPTSVSFPLGDIRFNGRATALDSADGRIAVVLQRSLDEKLAGDAPLRRFLLVLAVIGVTVSLIVAVLLAGTMTRPLRLLREGARRMRRGDYSEPIVIRQDDEIGQLADSFNDMRLEIASREKEILRLAYEDTLTGLPNRTSFLRTVESVIATDDTPPFAVLVLNLHRFRPINDSLGHAAGDHVLRQVALRLDQALPVGATLARLGADEFAVHLPDGASGERIGSLLLDMLRPPILHEAQPIDIGAGVGIARYPVHGGDAGTLLRRAEIAMSGAKRGIDDLAIYDPAVDVTRQEHLSLLGELRRAVEGDELRVHYQPKIDLAQGTVKGVEALVRWQHATRGLVPPGAFMPYAEQTGFVRQVTGWMLARSIAQCGRWLADGLCLQVSVNVSTRDLVDPELVPMLSRLLAHHDVPPTLLCLEVTESSVMEDPERALATLRAIAALGVELSIDDFGTGFSSLAYLKRMPVVELKIDRGFVMNMLTDPGDLTIVRSTIDLAHNLGLRVVAEGVETEGVMLALEACGCDVAQGYYASRPVSADDLLGWLGKSRWQAATSFTERSQV